MLSGVEAFLMNSLATEALGSFRHSQLDWEPRMLIEDNRNAMRFKIPACAGMTMHYNGVRA